ncbi:MAG: YsnF/AvaK domain-containing protein, partial [Chloroflexota bacterium]|nr:YsnF/AvaK domain-containing protein [Chloroflexota bacterium]
DAFSGESISVPVMEEQVEVRKVPRAVEEVEISKVQTQDTEVVSDTVRKEQVDIDQPVGSGTPRND